MDFYAVQDILPADHETAPPETRYELSDLDQETTPVYNLLALTYKLSRDFDKPAFLKHLQTGLSHTLAQIPITAGTLHRDAGNRFYIRRRNESTVKLGIRYMEEDESFPSYRTMKEKGFPSSIITSNRLKLFCAGSEPSILPMGIRIEDGCPISYFQVNFVRGGLLLTTAIHHLAADGGSVDAFTVAWAAATKASFEENDLPAFDLNIERTYFNATKPDAEELESLKQRVKGHKLIEVQPPPPASTQSTPPKQQPQIEDQIFHIRKSSLDNLKEECWPKEAGGYITPFDCITACVWKAVTRSRIPLHNWDAATTKTSVLSPLSVRGMFPSVGLNYFGNSIASALTGFITVAQLLEPDSLPKASQIIRQCVTDIKEETLPDVLKLRKGLEGTHKVKPNANFFFGTDIAITSLTNIRAFKQYDYGFGLPQAFMTPSWPADGVIALYPTCPWRSDDEGVEIQVTLEKSCLERMKQDKEFLKFCELR